MKNIISAFILMLFVFIACAQDDLLQYLQTNHYSFSSDTGFDRATADTLKQRLAGYKLILQAEGGSHYLNFYNPLRMVWLKFLQANFGLRYFFGESGHTSALLLNEYMQTADTVYMYAQGKTFWDSVYYYNALLPLTSRLKYFGIDFESRKTYLGGLRLILPASQPPDAIKPSIALIQQADDTSPTCDYITRINSKLKKALSKYKQEFVQYFGARYGDFEKIVLNNGDCGDVLANRNKHMAANFLSFDKEVNAPVYYGELGEAHTVLVTKNTASIIDASPGFTGKVCVVNAYCYNCYTPAEAVSNWPLKKIEKDILQYFLPYCTSDLTLFDLSGDSPLIKKYSAYGQFLIVAREQQ